MSAGELRQPDDAAQYKDTAQDIPCPLCDYNLHGLSDPRCPECGYQFAWNEVLDPTQRKHPYLFEHHPEANIASFFKTLWGGLRPRRFWSSLLPVQPSRISRMLLYLLIVLALAAVPLVMTVIMPVILEARTRLAANVFRRAQIERMMANPAYTGQPPRGYPSMQAYLDAQYPVSFWRLVRQETWRIRLTEELSIIMAAVMLWPWVMLSILFIFGEDRRRAGVRFVHVVRCVFYSFDVVVWGAALVFALWVEQIPLRGVWLGNAGPGVAAALIGLTLIVYTYRVIVAFRKYLRMNWAITQALLAQFITIPTTLLLTALVGRAVEYWHRY